KESCTFFRPFINRCYQNYLLVLQKFCYVLPFKMENQSVKLMFSEKGHELFYLIPNKDSRIIEFRNYYLYETYISTNSSFPPSVWASSSNFLYRTTNNCESFHAKFN